MGLGRIRLSFSKFHLDDMPTYLLICSSSTDSSMPIRRQNYGTANFRITCETYANFMHRPIVADQAPQSDEVVSKHFHLPLIVC
jgi:hypothetical protein